MLGKMRFDINEKLTPAEKGNLNMLLMSIGRADMIGKVMGGSFTRNEVKDLIDPLRNLVANCENDSDPNSAAPMIGAAARSILGKFEAFLG